MQILQFLDGVIIALHAGICSLYTILQALERLPAVAHLWAYCDFSLAERERAIVGHSAFLACNCSLPGGL